MIEIPMKKKILSLTLDNLLRIIGMFFRELFYYHLQSGKNLFEFIK